MATHPRKAQSLYRQVRLTFTLETQGRTSYSICAKGLTDQWDQRTVLVRDTVRVETPLNSTEDVISALIVILSEQTLPGHTT